MYVHYSRYTCMYIVCVRESEMSQRLDVNVVGYDYVRTLHSHHYFICFNNKDSETEMFHILVGKGV
jgi:hypothetical protein